MTSSFLARSERWPEPISTRPSFAAISHASAAATASCCFASKTLRADLRQGFTVRDPLGHAPGLRRDQIKRRPQRGLVQPIISGGGTATANNLCNPPLRDPERPGDSLLRLADLAEQYRSEGTRGALTLSGRP